jgi:uncharacterized protein (DUF2249 family)
MSFNPHSKISAVIAAHPDALDAIVSLSPRFQKLRNPILRKLMAGRTSIEAASKIGGCAYKDFVEKLSPLGLQFENHLKETASVTAEVPAWLQPRQNIVDLDVRPVLETGQDPLRIILDNLQKLQSSQILCVINSFEPTPLISLLANKGYESYVENNGDVCKTYFHLTDEAKLPEPPPLEISEGYDEMFAQFKDRMVEIDVRKLSMPMPMVRILETLATLPADKALWVHHRKVPAFLLPELKDRNYQYLIREIGPDQVDLLIYKSKL